MDCTQCREALSARLDGEENPAESDALDAHLATCTECCHFAPDAARLTRLVRAAEIIPAPDFARALLDTLENSEHVLRALTDLGRDSGRCAQAMMAYHTPGMRRATRAALDCADIAVAAYRILSRPTATDTGVVQAILHATATAAERCVAECGLHATHHEHCRVHSQSARRAADLCRSQLRNITR